MALLQAPARASQPTHDEPLVTPPDDVQKYWYLGRQHRWLLGLQGVSFALIAWSVLRFATADARLLLFLAPMTLYAVTLVVSLLSGTHRRQITLDGHLDLSRCDRAAVRQLPPDLIGDFIAYVTQRSGHEQLRITLPPGMNRQLGWWSRYGLG